MLTSLVTLLLSSAGIVLKMFLFQWDKSLIHFDPKSSGDFPRRLILVTFGLTIDIFSMVLEGDFVKHFAMFRQHVETCFNSCNFMALSNLILMRFYSAWD